MFRNTCYFALPCKDQWVSVQLYAPSESMNTIEKEILAHLHKLPEHLKTEVLHYVAFLSHTYAPAREEPKRYKRKFGSAAGKYNMAPDFSEPLDDFKAYT